MSLTLQPFELASETEADWSQAQESFFIDMMTDKAMAKGKKGSCCTFSKAEWLDMRKQHYYKWGCKHNLKAFKNKMTSLKERFRELTKLIEGDFGFKWDPVLKTVVASPSQWEDYIKSNPRAKRFSKKGCPEYEKLGLLFGDTRDMGRAEHTEHTSDNIEPMSSDDAAEAEAMADERALRQRSRSHSPSNNTRHEESGGSSDVTEALKRIAEISERRVAMSYKYSIAECMEILDAMGGDVGDRTYMRALKLLQEKGWREAFIRMSHQRRKGWLTSVEDGDI